MTCEKCKDTGYCGVDAYQQKVRCGCQTEAIRRIVDSIANQPEWEEAAQERAVAQIRESQERQAGVAVDTKTAVEFGYEVLRLQPGDRVVVHRRSLDETSSAEIVWQVAHWLGIAPDRILVVPEGTRLSVVRTEGE